jgi:hypothetical protein
MAERKRVNYVPAALSVLLNQACKPIDAALETHGCVGVFQVGSSLERGDYHDVDVRAILRDEGFDGLFPGAAGNPRANPLWSAMCTAFSLLLRHQTGLPVDFQIQRMSSANEQHKGTRNALGVAVLEYPGGG